jgi:hypothetical protein
MTGKKIGIIGFNLKKFKILFFVSFFIFGVFYYSFFQSYLSTSNKTLLNRYINKTISIQGYIKDFPVFINDNVIFELVPTKINNKSVIFKQNNSVIVASKFSNFSQIPEYKKCFLMDAKVRRIDDTEKYLLSDIGFKNNVFFMLDEITKIESKNEFYGNRFLYVLQKFRLKIFSSFYNPRLEKIYKNEIGFFKWIFTGEASDFPVIFKTKNFRSNPIFLIINAKLYLWFILIFTFLLAGAISLKRKIIYILSIFFVVFFCCFQLFSFSVLAPSLIIILFLFFASSLHSARALFYALNFGLFVLLIYDPFLLSSKWFIYFLAMSTVVILFTKTVDKFLCDKLKGWIFWGLFCLLLMSSFFGFYKPEFPKNIYFSGFVIFWIFAMLILQKKYPMQNLNYDNKLKSLRMFFSFWITLFFLAILPLSFIYGSQIDLSSVVLIFPVLLLFVLSFQIGFIGIIIYFVTLNMVPQNLDVYVKYYDMFSIFSNKIITKFILLFTANFNLRYLFVFKTSYLYIPLYFFILFFLFYLTSVKNFLEKIKLFFIKHFGKRNIILLALLLFFVALYFFAKSYSLNVNFFYNDYGKYFYLQTPKNKKILIIDLEKKSYLPLNLQLQYLDSDINFFMRNGVTNIDYLVIKNVLKNPDAFFVLNELFEKVEIKKNIFLDTSDLKSQNFFLNAFANNHQLFYDYSKPNITTQALQEEHKRFIFLFDILSAKNGSIFRIKFNSDELYILNNITTPKMIDMKFNSNFMSKGFFLDGYYDFRILIKSLDFEKKFSQDNYLMSDFISIKMFGNKVKIKGLK